MGGVRLLARLTVPSSTGRELGLRPIVIDRLSRYGSQTANLRFPTNSLNQKVMDDACRGRSVGSSN
jgi:hypothetical protein